MAVMKARQFVETALRIEQSPTVYYSVSGGNWAKWNGNSWNFDCVILVKAILWGFNFNKQASHGGAIYLSNGVKDDTADGIIKRCYDVSRDFSRIQYGELMHMEGHVGIYIGNGQVVEATAAWDHKVQISQVGSDGRRSKNGVVRGYWKEHGKLEYVDYSDVPQPPKPEPDCTGVITYQAYIGSWLGQIKKVDNTDYGYAGIYGKPISGFRCKSQYGELIYQAHVKGGNWLAHINSKDYDNGGDYSYAGIYGRPIDCIIIKSTKGHVTYRVHVKGGKWLAWIDSRTETGDKSYAGIYGKEIDGIQMY